MAFRKVTWYLWAGIGIVLTAYIVLGIWFRNYGSFENQLFKWGLIALTFAPVILMISYTFSGSKWWTNQVGSALALLSFGLTWMAWPLAWTFVFSKGVLLPGWVAWTEVSGPALIALAALWFTWVNIRLDRGRKRSNDPEK